MQKSCAEIIIDVIYNQGIDKIFGLPGGAAIPLFDAIVDSPVELILTRHEQGATHMADGMARATGKAGVVMVTSGPGATNTITGILTAHMDSVPLIVVCGQQTTWNLGLDAFQEADVSGISYPVVKHSYLIKDPHDAQRIVKEAFYLAQSGRPGPVLIDVPKDVSSAIIDTDTNTKETHDLPGYSIATEPDQKQIELAIALIKAASKPILLVGHGAVISGAEKAVRYLADRLQAPVTNTLLGKGCYPETEPLSVGMLGMHGTAYANLAMKSCDLILAIGSRWDDRIVGNVQKFCPHAKKIHIDIDSAEFDKTVRCDCNIESDARLAVEAIAAGIDKRPENNIWIKQVNAWKKKYPLKYRKGGSLKAQHAIEEIFLQTNGDAVVTADVGQHQMWAAQFYRTKHRFHWITTGGAGTMGFGMPAAIGAQCGVPDKMVIAIVGDGGFQMTLSELSTAVNLKIPIKIMLINNNYLGMVRQWQHLFYNNRLSGVDMKGNPNFVKLAESYGCKAFRIRRSADVRRVIQQALAYNDGPCLIDVEVEKEDNVYPMVPAGASYDDMIIEQPTAAQQKPLPKPVGST